MGESQMIEISDKEFQQLAEFVRERYGINLGKEKRALVMGRLQNVLLNNNFASFSAFYDHVISDKTGNAITTLVNRLSTNHTFFMRESDHFQFFKNTVLPYLVSAVANRDLRIWSAGCSTGEEPYTLAMIIADFLGSAKATWDTKVLATDISANCLQTAARGVYLNDNVASLPASWKLEYFKKLDADNSMLVDRIKNEIIFRNFNLMQPFPFKKRFHVIFCRNVMIYFNAHTKAELINKFYDFTEPGGYLFIGHAESLQRDNTPYKYIIPAVYRKD